MKAKAWPQIIEIPPGLPDRRNADPAATSKLSAFDLDQVVARATGPRKASPTLTDEAGNELQADMPPLAGNTSDEALLAKLKPAPSRAGPVIQEKEPLPGSLDAGWEDDASAESPPPISEVSEVVAAELAPEGVKTAPPPPLEAKTAPPPPLDVGTKTAPPPGLPTPLLPGPLDPSIFGLDGIARLSDPADEIEEQTKIGDSLVESIRGSRIANLADDDEDDEESSREGLTVIGDSLVQSGMTDAPNVEALTAMRASDEPKVALADALPMLALAADVLPMLAPTTDPLPKLSAPDELRVDSSAPPSNDLEARPASSPMSSSASSSVSSPVSSSKPMSSPAPRGLAASARPSWMSSRYAIVAGVLLALVTVLAAMRLLRH